MCTSAEMTTVVVLQYSKRKQELHAYGKRLGPGCCIRKDCESSGSGDVDKFRRLELKIKGRDMRQ